MAVRIAVINQENDPQAVALATQLNIPLITTTAYEYDFLFQYQNNRLALIARHWSEAKPLMVDFLEGKLAYRQKHRTGQERLIRSLGGSPEDIKVIDATAGLGTDAFMMASYGYQVTMIERSPILHALVQDGLKRLNAVTDKFSNLKLINADSLDYLKNLASDQYPEVIYLDPMFPERKKSALVKKELRIIRDLIGEQTSDEVLFALAKTIAKKRVVVKRPLHAPPLTLEKPSFAQIGTTCRFDIYVIRENSS